MGLHSLTVLARDRSNSFRRRAYDVLAGRGKAPRLPSFPFISGDTFRSVAHFVVEKPEAVQTLRSREVELFSEPGLMVFCQVDQLTNLATGLASVSCFGNKVTLVIHNGDVVDSAAVEALSDKFHQVLCVNWMGSQSVAQPIPIGLENVAINVNGRLTEHMDKYPRHLQVLRKEKRPSSVLVSFNVATNPDARSGVSSIFRDVQGTTIRMKRTTRAGFQADLLHHYFVVSPPGNGLDCHRTWEAMYAGCVPIVLRQAWPFDGERLPVLAVDNWGDARELLEGDPEVLYSDIWQGSRQEEMYFSHYVSKFAL